VCVCVCVCDISSLRVKVVNENIRPNDHSDWSSEWKCTL